MGNLLFPNGPAFKCPVWLGKAVGTGLSARPVNAMTFNSLVMQPYQISNAGWREIWWSIRQIRQTKDWNDKDSKKNQFDCNTTINGEWVDALADQGNLMGSPQPWGCWCGEKGVPKRIKNCLMGESFCLYETCRRMTEWRASRIDLMTVKKCWFTHADANARSTYW